VFFFFFLAYRSFIYLESAYRHLYHMGNLQREFTICTGNAQSGPKRGPKQVRTLLQLYRQPRSLVLFVDFLIF